MKKSIISALLLGACLSACGPSAEEARIAELQKENAAMAAKLKEKSFSSPDECAASGVDKEACLKGYQAAQADFQQNSPKYSSLQECIAVYGVDKCEPRQNSDGSSFFGPLFMGYMIGNMLSDGGYSSRPVYRDRHGYYRDPYRPSYRSRSVTQTYPHTSRSPVVRTKYSPTTVKPATTAYKPTTSTTSYKPRAAAPSTSAWSRSSSTSSTPKSTSSWSSSSSTSSRSGGFGGSSRSSFGGSRSCC